MLIDFCIISGLLVIAHLLRAVGVDALRFQRFGFGLRDADAGAAQFGARGPCAGVALGELARRYLVGHGPAGERDLAAWAGITLGAGRAVSDKAGKDEHTGGQGLDIDHVGLSGQPLD